MENENLNENELEMWDDSVNADIVLEVIEECEEIIKGEKEFNE